MVRMQAAQLFHTLRHAALVLFAVFIVCSARRLHRRAADAASKAAVAAAPDVGGSKGGSTGIQAGVRRFAKQ